MIKSKPFHAMHCMSESSEKMMKLFLKNSKHKHIKLFHSFKRKKKKRRKKKLKLLFFFFIHSQLTEPTNNIIIVFIHLSKCHIVFA